LVAAGSEEILLQLRGGFESRRHFRRDS